MTYSKDNIISQLLKAQIFKECDCKALAHVIESSNCRIRKKTAESIITYAGEECKEVMILLHGTIYSTMSGEEKEIVVEQLTGPVVLAPAFIFASKNIMPVNVTCKTDCTLLYIDKSAFLEMLHHDSHLMMNFIQAISDRCRRLSQRLNNFAIQSLKERVKDYLLRHQRIDNVGWLSRVLGVARPSLSRVLSELKSEGLIERTLNGIELKKT